MKEINLGFGILIAGLLSIPLVGSCDRPIPKVQKPTITYELGSASFVPDSLKDDQRKFVIETVRAASQHMTGGDYEDVDDTIEQAQETSEELFEVTVPTLYKVINDHGEKTYVHILPEQLNEREKRILDSLIHSK